MSVLSPGTDHSEPLLPVTQEADNQEADSASKREKSIESYGLSLCVAAAANFSITAEYTVVLPTLYVYLNQLGSFSEDHWHLKLQYSLALAMFSCSKMITRPLWAVFSDRVKKFRPAYMFSICFSIAGNLLYTFAAAWNSGPSYMGGLLVIAARTVCGAGTAATMLQWGYAAQVTSKANRTSVMSRLGMVQTCGLTLGPLLNLVCSRMDFDLGFVRITSVNAPGLAMAVLQLIILILLAAFLKEPHKRPSAKPAETSAKEQPKDASGGAGDSDSAPARPRIVAVKEKDAKGHGSAAHAERKKGPSETEFSWLQIGCMAFVLGTAYFAVGVLEAAITPICNLIFGFGAVRISLLFAAGAVSSIISSAAVSRLSRMDPPVSDGSLMMGGALLMVAAQALALLCWKRSGMGVVQFAAPIMVVFAAAFPLLILPARSRLSKMVESKGSARPSFWQSMFGLVGSAGQMAGPVFAAFSLHLHDRRFATTTNVVMCALSVVVVLCLGVAFNSLWSKKPPRRTSPSV